MSSLGAAWGFSCWYSPLFSPQRGWDSYMVYLFDKSKTVYDGPFASRSLSDCVNYIGECTHAKWNQICFIKPSVLSWRALSDSKRTILRTCIRLTPCPDGRALASPVCAFRLCMEAASLLAASPACLLRWQQSLHGLIDLSEGSFIINLYLYEWPRVPLWKKSSVGAGDVCWVTACKESALWHAVTVQ